jgi:hypothetical protein
MRLATCHVLEPPTEASVFTLREALLVSVWPSSRGVERAGSAGGELVGHARRVQPTVATLLRAAPVRNIMPMQSTLSACC